jgi:hypothetical protein
LFAVMNPTGFFTSAMAEFIVPMMKLVELEAVPDPDGGKFGTSLKGAFLTPFNNGCLTSSSTSVYMD